MVLICITLIFFFFFFLIICGSLGLWYCTQAFSSCGAVGLAVVPCGLLIAVASFVAEHRLQSSWSSVIVAHRLSRSDHWTTKEVLHVLDNY